MQKRAKTRNLITILSTILSAVFALSIGFTFAPTSKTKDYNATPMSVSAYLGNNSYTVINNADSVLFGEGFHNNEISIEYSYAYDFDIRIKYSLSWSETNYKFAQNLSSTYQANTYYSSANINSLLESKPANWETNYGDYYVLLDATTTDNAILSFYDRDNWIVDDTYIFHTTSIGAGQGTLKLLSGVSFIDPYDELYLGSTLSISIDEVVIVKDEGNDDADKVRRLFIDSNNYPLITLSTEEDHELEIDSFTSEAAAGFYHYITDGAGLSGDAFVIAYNPRNVGLKGAPYPMYDTAYSRTSSGSASWLGGNTFIANIGIYVVVGKNPITLRAKVSKAWLGNGELNASNNILENFNSSWVHYSWDTDDDICDFNFKLSAGQAYFIPVVDRYEITSEISAGNTILYQNCKAYFETLTLNGTNFNFSSKTIEAKEISDAANGRNTSYSASAYTINNQSYLNNSLFRNTNNTYYTPIYLTNNTDDDKTYTITYSLNYRFGNGQILTDHSTTFNNGSGYFYEQTGSVSNGNSTCYYRVNGNNFNSTYLNTESYTVKAHSVRQIVSNFMVTDAFETYFANLLSSTLGVSYTTNSDHYDVWVYLGASVTSSSNNSAANISAYTVKDGTSVKVCVKNNTDEKYVLSALSVSVLSYEYQQSFSNSVTSSEPLDWNSDYWRYYSCDSNGDNVSNSHNTSKTFTGYYVKDASDYVEVLQSLSVSSITILPNESYCLGTLDTITDDSRVAYNLVVTYTSSSATPTDVKLINSGTSNAYIENFSSSNSYYVRFTGTYSGSDTRIKNASTYNYYIGIIRPGQIFEVPMSVSGTLSYIVVPNSTYSNSDLSTWAPGDTILGYYTTYFN